MWVPIPRSSTIKLNQHQWVADAFKNTLKNKRNFCTSLFSISYHYFFRKFVFGVKFKYILLTLFLKIRWFASTNRQRSQVSPSPLPTVFVTDEQNLVEFCNSISDSCVVAPPLLIAVPFQKIAREISRKERSSLLNLGSCITWSILNLNRLPE